MNEPIRLPCGCRVTLDAEGWIFTRDAPCPRAQQLYEAWQKAYQSLRGGRNTWRAVAGREAAYRRHADGQVAAAREAVTREVAATLDGLASDDPAEFEAARQSEMGQMVRKAARKRGEG